MRNRTYGGVRGRKTKVGRKLLRFPPTRYCMLLYLFHYLDSLAALLHDIESFSIAIDLHTL